MRKNVGYEGLVAEILPQENIDNILGQVLSSREAEVVRGRFGLNTELKTLEEIAENFGVSRERVRQIEFRALRKLRKRIFAKPVISKGEESALPYESRFRGLLLTPISELELSVRSANCFKMANIRIIADLVIKNEEELLGLKYFGKKSLSEIKSLLESLGLSLRMKLPNKFNPPAR
ncbi:hypothetical protein A3G50_00920 [Candidatus Jorgensenbacteria bacterium RIFCSPLOWO2_12_FULL_42_11]|uniref:RNA polymerase sigma-70 domain-containing protein n=1 Tax=Candidatus Jorgensenbacteria bacterium RIFCSPLOWO2_12_FULL_42_11 TaxID=1798473 RepID=A0A1F6C3M0_9BACT|nr:MAG: hypothetical protein A3G50_00920 [Candidatus Jorgensenbacteria bacterium RIFCSPLOWO2_12_FULL_42_11]